MRASSISKCEMARKCRIVRAEKTKGALQEREHFWLVMIAFGADFDQLDKIRGRLRARVSFANSAERIAQRNFAQSMKIGFAAARDGNVGFEKKIELAGKGTLGLPRAFGDGADDA